MATFTSDFNLSVTRALRDQLIDELEAIRPAPLAEDNILQVARRGGVYQLFFDEELVYIGKSTRDLAGRLRQHMRKISGRRGALLRQTSFRCVYITEDLDALAPEKMLIGLYKQAGGAAWNFNGFGNKDPGKRRDTSLVEANHFDRKHMIDLEIEVEVRSAANLLEVFEQIKQALPYTFRYESKGSRTALQSIGVTAEIGAAASKTAQDWMSFLVNKLPAGWTIVALPGYVIAYPDIVAENYESRSGAWTSISESVGLFTQHDPTFVDREILADVEVSDALTPDAS